VKSVLNGLDEVVAVFRHDLAGTPGIITSGGTLNSTAGSTSNGITTASTASAAVPVLSAATVNAIATRIGQSIRKLRTLKATTTLNTTSNANGTTSTTTSAVAVVASTEGEIKSVLDGIDSEVARLNKEIAIQGQGKHHGKNTTSGTTSNTTSGTTSSTTSSTTVDNLQMTFMLREMKLERLQLILQVINSLLLDY
jgi:hypothetical protein